MTNSTDDGQEGKEVTFTVVSGPNQGVNGTDTTNSDGIATYTFVYPDVNGTGTDNIQACFQSKEGLEVCSQVVEKEWTKEMISLSPLFAENSVNTNHTINATLQDLLGNPISGKEVRFAIIHGPNEGVNATGTTNSNGLVQFTYNGTKGVGRDAIQACFTSAAEKEVCTDYENRFASDAFKEWFQGNDKPCPPIEPNPDKLPLAVKDEPYNVQFTGFGSNGTYTFEADGLPEWVEWNGSSGEFFGTPNTDGTFSFTITAVDENGCTGSRAYELQVCPRITFDPNTQKLPDGFIGGSYQQTIFNSQSAATTFTLSNGTLPDGLQGERKNSRYIISGTPTTVGIWTFTLTADTGKGCLESKKYTIEVLAAPGPAKTVPTVSEWGMLFMALALAFCSLMVLMRRRIN